MVLWNAHERAVMTSLTEVYEEKGRGRESLRRLHAGTALMLAGAVLAVFGVVLATSDGLFANQWTAREYGGIVSGLALPVALVGVFVVLPASRRIRAAAAISASICLLGVVLFAYAYPYHWAGVGRDLTLLVSGVYLLGAFASFWILFVAVVNFKTRNNPGGTLEMNVVRRGRTKIVEADATGSLGGIGLLGTTPDGEVETQTNEPSESVGGDVAVGSFDSDSVESTTTQSAASNASTSAASNASTSAASNASTSAASNASTTRSSVESAAKKLSQAVGTRSSSSTSPAGPSATTSDGGADASDISSPLDGEERFGGRDAEIVDPTPNSTETTDRYCGNCRHFEYVRERAGMVPYCRFTGETMDDMDACEEWTANRR